MSFFYKRVPMHLILDLGYCLSFIENAVGSNHEMYPLRKNFDNNGLILFGLVVRCGFKLEIFFNVRVRDGDKKTAFV